MPVETKEISATGKEGCGIKEEYILEALKQIMIIPKDHELKIKVPQNIPENETVEVILIIKKRNETFRKRITELKYAANDRLFLDDMRDISKDFESVDSEGW